MTQRVRARVVLTVMAAACASVAPPAVAAPTWLPAASLAGGSADMSLVQADADARGAITAAWVRETGAGDSLEIGTRAPGGSFETATLHTGAANAISGVALSVNAGGDAIAAWIRSNGSRNELWFAIRTGAGGSFTTPQLLQSLVSHNTFDPSAAVNDAGAMMVVWRLSGGGTETVYGAFKAVGETISDPFAISTSDVWNQSPRVALAADGKATVVWSHWSGGSDPQANKARVRVRAADGTFGTQRDLTAGTPTGYPMFATVGVDGAGNAVSVWSRWTGAIYEVLGATRAAGADTWNALPKFGESASASFGSEPQVTVDAAGNAVAIWRAANGTMNAAHRAPGAAFGAAQLGISAPSALSPRVSFDGLGNAIAVWRRIEGAKTRIEASVRPAGGSFGAVRTLSAEYDNLSSATPYDAALAVDPLGNAFVGWPQQDTSAPAGTTRSAWFAAYDASAPELSASIPGSGQVGQALGFSAAVTDVWSPVDVAWDFGDGQGAGGASPQHAFGSAGTFAVKVTATDAVGNSTSRSGSAVVSAPPPAAAPPVTGAQVVRLASSVRNRWLARKRFTRVLGLSAIDVPAGATVTVKCRGRGCPFASKRRVAKRAGTLGLTKLFNTRRQQARLRPGARIEVRVQQAGAIGRWTAFVIRAKAKPRTTRGCLAPGTGARQRC